MKHIFFRCFYAIFSGLVVMAGGCTKEIGGEAVPGNGNGALQISVSLPDKTRAEEYNPLDFSTMKIFKVERDAEDKLTESLIRKYRPATSVPSNLYLAAGEYKITVEAGTGDEATFDHKTYYGEESFTIEANKTKVVPVVCRITNIAVKVVFDPTVAAAFDTEHFVYVSAADTFSKENAESSSVPTLKFVDSGTGFFLLPEGVSHISWGFYGKSTDADINAKGQKTGVIENPEKGKQYTLTYAYSKDADGFLSVSVKVREYESAHDDNFTFSPQPTLSGDGFSIAQTVGFYKDPVKLQVSSINPLSSIKFTVDGTEYTVMEAGVPSETNAGNGITYTVTDQFSGKIQFEPSFFDRIAGGIKSLDFVVTDTDNSEGSATVKVAVQGASGILGSDLWFGTAKIGAVVTNPDASSVKIRYRESGAGEWSEVEAVKGTDGFTYTADVTGFTADKTYEFQMMDAGTESGKLLSVKTEAGIQLPNAGFEEWHQSGSPWYPYAQGGTEFWATGNPGATSVGASYNLTSGSEDVRPGSSGKLSARLETKKPSVMGIGKLAAGNIFIGQFGAVSGMGGSVNMGREFSFNAKPKALRVWYKYTPKGSDKGRIFVCLVNMTDGSKYHVVNTNSPNQTTFSPDDEFLYADKTNTGTLQGHIIGYGDLMLETTVSDWTMVEIPITYREQYSSERSNVLMVTASASYRGDYFEGEVGSLMYLDDVEFVY